MFDISRDIHSLTDFKKNTSKFIEQISPAQAQRRYQGLFEKMRDPDPPPHPLPCARPRATGFPKTSANCSTASVPRVRLTLGCVV